MYTNQCCESRWIRIRNLNIYQRFEEFSIFFYNFNDSHIFPLATKMVMQGPGPNPAGSLIYWLQDPDPDAYFRMTDPDPDPHH